MTPYVKALQRFLLEQAGLAFDVGKLYLAESQLAPLAREHGLPSVDALIARLQTGFDAELARQAVEAMTTHETFFFRDRVIFEKFRTAILPELVAARAQTRRLRIWCAAVSTGQEAYSLAMILDDEARKLKGWNIELLATDISHRAIDVAQRGVYTQFEVQRGLSVAYLLRYFNRHQDDWAVAEHIKTRVNFRPVNLIRDFSRLGTFDVIFCRNVLMYFDAATRKATIAQLVDALAPDGYFVTGATEPVAGLVPQISPLAWQASIGRKTPSVARRSPLRLVGAG